MALTCEWKVTGMKIASGDDLTDVVVRVYFNVLGEDGNGNQGAYSGGATFNLATIDPNQFTPYADLTEEQVIGWIKTTVIGTLNDYAEECIQDEINNSTTTQTYVGEGDFPWSPPKSE
jgi:hypothetical protein